MAGMVIGIILLIAIPHTVSNPQVPPVAHSETKPAEATHNEPEKPTATVTEHTPEKAPEVAPATAHPEETPPQEAAAATEAPAGDATTGQAVYASNCAGCHGANAEGGIGTALVPTKEWSFEAFTTALRDGKSPTRTLAPVMPKFTADRLSDGDIANIHAYIKTLH